MATAVCVSSPSVILLSAPATGDRYYANNYRDTLQFQASFLKQIQFPDHAFILADSGSKNYLLSLGVSNASIIPIALEDIWIRDFGPVRPSRLTLFQYQPKYLRKSEARSVQESLIKGFRDLDVQLESFQTDIILDGGNVVDNEKDTAIITSRVINDNKKKTKQEIIGRLRKDLDYNKIIIVDELPGDTTGHTDGMASFIDMDVLAVSQLGSPHHERIMTKLHQELDPNVKIVEIPNHPDETFKANFPSACGLHINLIATESNLYVPTFGHDPASQKLGHTTEMDESVLSIIWKNTSKKVVPIPVPKKVCEMGGSVRCLSCQVVGTTAQKILNLAARLAK